jgi:carbamoylphosphate synthase small subunit
MLVLLAIGPEERHGYAIMQAITRMTDGATVLGPGGVYTTIRRLTDDGLIEAFRVRNARRFAVAVQWHPEWKPREDDFSTALFKAFGVAAHERAAQDNNR